MGDISLEAVLHFIISNGGRVQNQKLVTHFRDALNHPTNKAANREKFKDYVTELAAIKVEEGQKVLVLKKKYHQASETPSSASVSTFQDSSNAHSEPSAVTGTASEMDIDSPDGGMVSKARIDEKMEVKMRNTDRIPASSGSLDSVNMSSVTGSTASLTSAGSQKSLASSTSGVSSMGDDGNTSVISVKDKIKNLNKNISDSDLTRVRPGGAGGGNKKSYKHIGVDDDASESVTLTAEQKDWLVVCASSDYHDMNRLLSRNPGLAKLKDISNGYTALHWAAKSGKSEVIKLIASKPGVAMDQRSHGGYTALHLAAIHGHDHIIELLVQTYKADAGLRDYSGKKAKQYQKNCALSKSQPIHVSRKLGSDQGNVKSSGDSSFIRSSMRKSNRNKGVSSLMQAVSAVARQPLMNFSRSNEDMGDEKDGHLKTPTGSARSSPDSSRKNLSEDGHLMPPPSDSMMTRRNSERSKSSSRESSPSLRDRNDENQDMMRSGSDSFLEKMSVDNNM